MTNHMGVIEEMLKNVMSQTKLAHQRDKTSATHRPTAPVWPSGMAVDYLLTSV